MNLYGAAGVDQMLLRMLISESSREEERVRVGECTYVCWCSAFVQCFDDRPHQMYCPPAWLRVSAEDQQQPIRSELWRTPLPPHSSTQPNQRPTDGLSDETLLCCRLLLERDSLSPISSLPQSATEHSHHSLTHSLLPLSCPIHVTVTIHTIPRSSTCCITSRRPPLAALQSG